MQDPLKCTQSQEDTNKRIYIKWIKQVVKNKNLSEIKIISRNIDQDKELNDTTIQSLKEEIIKEALKANNLDIFIYCILNMEFSEKSIESIKLFDMHHKLRKPVHKLFTLANLDSAKTVAATPVLEKQLLPLCCTAIPLDSTKDDTTIAETSANIVYNYDALSELITTNNIDTLRQIWQTKQGNIYEKKDHETLLDVAIKHKCYTSIAFLKEWGVASNTGEKWIYHYTNAEMISDIYEWITWKVLTLRYLLLAMFNPIKRCYGPDNHISFETIPTAMVLQPVQVSQLNERTGSIIT